MCIRDSYRRGGHVLGICGGFQMLGQRVSDPDGIEGPPGETEGIEGPPGDTDGIGLLDVETIMTGDKRLSTVEAVHAPSGQLFDGYEIHIGRSDGPDRARPFARVAGQDEGAISADGRVAGSYLHGMFRDDAFRRAWLASFDGAAGDASYTATVETTLDALADHLEAHVDVGALLACAR